jgi:hypothetical protein
MKQAKMNVSIRRLPENADMFEFSITTPTLRSQFIITRAKLNKLRSLIEKALISKRPKN